jgi:Mrp family chromosome partitioning ATPase
VLAGILLILALAAAVVAAAAHAPASVAPSLSAGLSATGPITVALIGVMLAVFGGLIAWRARWPLNVGAISAEAPLLPPASVPSILGRCPVVGVIGVESGSGSSTIAFNLAVATAVDGRLPVTAPRAGRPRPMCLLTEGALSASLGVEADALMELLERNVARVPDEVVSLAKRHPSGVEVLALAPGRLNVEQLRRLLQLLRRHYDAIVIDCPRGDLWLEEIVTQVVDVLLLVALSSDRSAGECRRWVDRLWRQRAEQRAAVLVNRRTLSRPSEGVTRGFVHSIHISDNMPVADFDSRGVPWVLDTSLAPASEMGKVAAALMPPMFAEAQSGAA